MKAKKMWQLLAVLMVLVLAMAACGGNAEVENTIDEAEETAEEVVDEVVEEPDTTAGETTTEGSYQIPAIEEGMHNVAFVYVGPHDDGGWSQSHDVGRLCVQETMEGVHTAYVENVAEGADAEQVIRSLARKGFDTIFTTSFGSSGSNRTRS